jgi:hypothetical protein
MVVRMTLQQTIDVPADRRVSFDFLAPQEIPTGTAEVVIIFNAAKPKATVSNAAVPAIAAKGWRSLRGLYKDTGDTLNAYLERHRADNALEYELEELHLKEREQRKQ